MRVRGWKVLGLIGVLAAGTAAGTWSLQEENGNEHEGMSAMDAKWAAFMTPGEHHEVLDHKVGKWTGKVTMMMPGEEPSESTSTSTYQWIMGGRYLEDSTTGDFQGMPFEGRGITAYDNMKKKYVATWIDNLGTGIMMSEGKYDAASKTFEFHGDMPDVNMGKYVKARTVEKIADADHWTMEMYQETAAGEEALVMKIEYTRAQ